MSHWIVRIVLVLSLAFVAFAYMNAAVGGLTVVPMYFVPATIPLGIICWLVVRWVRKHQFATMDAVLTHEARERDTLTDQVRYWRDLAFGPFKSRVYVHVQEANTAARRH